MTDASPSRPSFAGWLGTTNTVTRTFLAAGRIPGLINLGGGLPAPETYPGEEMAEIARRVVAENPAAALGYGPIEGLPELRDALAATLAPAGATLSRENVLVTTSGMQGLDLLGKVLIDEGSIVAAQFPTYLGALDAWRPRRPHYRPMRLEDPEFDAEAALAGARFGYVVPNFSNPTGRLVGLDLRRRLAGAAERTGTWLVEDDPYGGLLFDGAPLPRIFDLAGGGDGHRGPVVYMGTVSKQIAPGLRVGWIVAERPLIEALVTAKQGSDLCTSGVTQLIALEAIRSGIVERLRPELVALYRARRDALCAALADLAGEHLAFETPVGGMFVWATVRSRGIDTDRLLAACLDAGVCVSPSSVFDPAGQNRLSLRLNFTLNAPDVLAEGVRRLVVALKSVSVPGR